MLNSKLLCWNDSYIGKILSWRNLNSTKIGRLYKIETYTSYNNIITLNSMFSSFPSGSPIDRTQQINSPFNIIVKRPWAAPTKQLTLEEALECRVRSLSQHNKKINAFWSGGIDSTTLVTALLKHLSNKSQLRILYSPNSVFEHPEYIDFLKQFTEIELVDTSGTTYLTKQYDGIFVTGDSGDELNASLDQSFFDDVGYAGLSLNWKDFFLFKHANLQFIEFCEQHFAAADRPIETVLQARWWFYATCKVNAIMWQKIPWFFNYQNFDYNDFIGFYDCNEYESYIYWNIEDVLPNNNYSSWKQHFKDYCYKFDGIDSWYNTKTKTHSNQVNHYVAKKCALNDQRWFGLLANGERLHTPSLPILTHKELNLTYGNRLDYLFNEPD